MARIKKMCLCSELVSASQALHRSTLSSVRSWSTGDVLVQTVRTTRQAKLLVGDVVHLLHALSSALCDIQ